VPLHVAALFARAELAAGEVSVRFGRLAVFSKPAAQLGRPLEYSMDLEETIVSSVQASRARKSRGPALS